MRPRATQGASPNDAALLRLTACVLIEAHDEWAAGDRRYLSEASMAALHGTNIAASPISAVATTTGGREVLLARPETGRGLSRPGR